MTVRNAHTTNQNSAMRKSLSDLLSDNNTDFESFIKSELEKFGAFIRSHGIDKPLIDIDLKQPPLYPKDPTLLSDSDVGRIYAEFVAWLGYCSFKLANAEAEVIYFLSVEEKSEKLLMNYYVSELGVNEKVAKTSMERDPEMLHVRDCVTRAKAKKKHIEGIYVHYEHCMKGLSREISRRKGDEPIFTASSIKK